MNRTEATYGQLDNVLRKLGFACQVVSKTPPTRRYDHVDSGAWIMLPVLPDGEPVLDYHLASVRTTLDGFGIADPTAFAAQLQKAG